MIYERGPLQWIDSAGGPLLLLSSEHFSEWRGVFTEFDSYGYDWPYPDPPPPQATDYDRACAITGYVGLVDVGEAQGVVLGDEPMSTAWWPLSGEAGILIRWKYADESANLLQRLLPIDEGAWEPSDVSVACSGQSLYLFDSSAAGEQETERLTITFAAGEYAVDTGFLQPDPHTQMVVHRVRRMG